jgi:hypothetical protein
MNFTLWMWLELLCGPLALSSSLFLTGNSSNSGIIQATGASSSNLGSGGTRVTQTTLARQSSGGASTSSHAQSPSVGSPSSRLYSSLCWSGLCQACLCSRTSTRAAQSSRSTWKKQTCLCHGSCVTKIS